MQVEQTLVESFMNFLDELDVKNKVDFCSLSTTDHDTLLKFVKQIVLVFSNRIKNVREHYVKKETALTKFKKLGGNDWRKSKYAIVISHIQTWMYQGSSSVESILNNLDKLCCAIAQSNDLHNCYHEVLVDLGHQENYICLQEADSATVQGEGVDRVINPRSIKQGSDFWHRLRSSAKVTGSTAYKAIGLESLKKQQEHFDHVFCKQDKPEFSTRTKLCLDHGVKNEINCVATLVSKVLPVYFPELSYKEEGCNIEVIGNAFFVCSPDGSCAIGGDGDPVLSCEFKCPMPGNMHATPVHYKIPIYYAIQLLAEMNTLKTDKLLYMSYSEQSSTVFQVTNDTQLWLEILEELQRIYGTEIPKRPTKKSPAVEVLRDKIKTYLDNNCEFLGEFRSAKARRCRCSLSVSNVPPSADVAGYNCIHENDNNTAISHIISLDEVRTAIKKLSEDLGSADRLTMSQATEILVYILSDLDRNRSLDKPHAVPIGYALKGYSLPVTLFRKMLLHALASVNELIYCPISCFDGQWFPIVSRSADDKPLTLIQLQKDCLKEAKSLSKPVLISAVRSCYRDNKKENQINHIKDSVSFRNSKTLQKALVGEKVKLQSEETNNVVENGNPVIDILPQSALGDNEIVEEILEIETSLQNKSSEVTFLNPDAIECSNIDIEANIACLNREGAEESQNQEDVVDRESPYTDTDCEKMLLSLKTDPKRQAFWLPKSLTELQDMIKTSVIANKYLQKCDILVCLRSVRDNPKLQNKTWKSSWTKPKLLETFLPNNNIEQIAIKETARNVKTKACFKPVSLKELCTTVIDDRVKSINKETLNVIYAELIYPHRLAEFRRTAPIKDAVKVTPFDLPEYWYCQPEFLPQLGIYHFSFIDPTHILTNLRTKICTTGIEDRNLKRSSWLEVAKECKTNKTSLNRSVIEDVIDKQNVGYALKLFSLKVEQVLEEKGKLHEARFCRVIREWYEAEDDRGIAVAERCRRRLQLRTWLLEGIDLEQFCWYGRYVKGIPIVTFESLMINIDRRLQLYPYTKSGSYNVRTIGSLENEEFFGEFHELDPKHVGLLHPNDIQTVMHTALEVSSARLNSER